MFVNGTKVCGGYSFDTEGKLTITGTIPRLTNDEYKCEVWTGESALPKIKRKHYKVLDFIDADVPCKYITFCYLHTDQGTAVGISICSELDEFDDSRGREIALGRAEAALKERKSSRMIHKPEYRGLRDYGVFALSHWVADER